MFITFVPPFEQSVKISSLSFNCHFKDLILMEVASGAMEVIFGGKGNPKYTYYKKYRYAKDNCYSLCYSTQMFGDKL